MIHRTRQGEVSKIGLNWNLTKQSFYIFWVWFDITSLELYGRYFEIKWSPNWDFFRAKDRWNVVDDYCARKGLVMVTKEILHDARVLK